MSGAQYPPGVVGVIAQDTARFSMFAASLTGIEVPPGTSIKWIFGHSVAGNCNELVRTLLQEAPDAQWLWILGDDHSFSSDLLMKLLAHDCDIVAPLCLTRNPPYKPVMFSDWADEGAPLRKRLWLDDHPDGGLVEIHSVGSAGLLVKREVFEELADPWFESGVVGDTGEDVYFCDKARDAGFYLYGDLDANLGHLTTAAVWPVRQPEGWTYGFSFMGGMKVTMPPDAWAAADLVALGGEEG